MSPLFRKRWDAEYLLSLSLNENSFVAEYRLNFKCFNILVDLLKETSALNVDFRMARRATDSKLISIESRIAVCLILLGGGRYIEAMRTHGIARFTVYYVFHQVVEAINSHPQLAIECSSAPLEIAKRSSGFRSRSSIEIFRYVTGAIDGLAIEVTPKKVQNQTQFLSGTLRHHVEIIQSQIIGLEIVLITCHQR